MKKTHSMLFIPGIIMLGIVLRTPFTTLPTVLSDIAAGLGLMWALWDYWLACHFSPLPFSHLLRFNLLKIRDWAPLLSCLDRNDDRICHSDYQPPLPLSGNHLDWSWHCLSQCAASKPDSGKQTPATRHSDHFVHHFYGDVHSDRRFCGCSDHQTTSWQGLVNILTAFCALALLIWIPNLRYNHHLKRRWLESSSKWYTNKYVWAIMILVGFSLYFLYKYDLASNYGCSAGLSKVESGLLATVFPWLASPSPWLSQV